MSRDQVEYDQYRIIPYAAGEEFTHPVLLGFDYTTSIDNLKGTDPLVGTSSDAWLDFHKIPKGLVDWDGVWNWHMIHIGSAFLHQSVRIARLHEQMGIEDPEAKTNPNGPGSTGSISSMPTVNSTVYTYVEPDTNDKVEEVIDGSTVVVAIGQLRSIVGTRNYTGVRSEGHDWKHFDDRDGYWVSHSTTITHNIDQLDQLAGPPVEHTGYTSLTSDGFWNAKDLKVDLTDRDAPFQWSANENIEQINRSIGSRVIPNEGWNLNRSDILSSMQAGKTEFADAQQTVTDFVIDINNILGSRTIQASPAQVYAINTSYPIQNAGVTSDNTTFSTLLSNLNEAIGHRNIENRSNYYPFRSNSHNTVTQWINQCNNVIGNRIITSKSGSFPLQSSDDTGVTAVFNTINNTFGDRVINNTENNYVLQGSTSGLTMTEYVNKFNTQVGNRLYTHDTSSTGRYPILTDGAIITTSLNEINTYVATKLSIKEGYNPITSLVDDVAGGTEAYTTSGWFDNADTVTLKAIIQQLVDRIDAITGWDT